MLRYYFHVRDGHTPLDDTGFDCASMAEVRKEALRTAGAIVLTLSFSAANRSTRGNPESWSGSDTVVQQTPIQEQVSTPS